MEPKAEPWVEPPTARALEGRQERPDARFHGGITNQRIHGNQTVPACPPFFHSPSRHVAGCSQQGFVHQYFVVVGVAQRLAGSNGSRHVLELVFVLRVGLELNLLPTLLIGPAARLEGRLRG